MPRKKKESKHKGVFKSPTGSGDYSVRFTDLDGKRPTFVVGPHNQAVHVYELHSQAARAGLEVPHDAGRGVRFSTIAEEAVTWYLSHRKSAAAFSAMVDLAIDKFGNRNAEAITAEEYEEWLCDLADERDWSNGRQNQQRSALITIYREAMRAGKVRHNPARDIHRNKVPLGRVRFLEEEEEARLRDAIVAPLPGSPWDWQEAVWDLDIALHTGMRKGEQHSLTWDQVDLATKIVYLDETKNGSSRYVRLNTIALGAFTELKQRHDRLGYPADAPVFSVSNPSRWFAAAVERAGIEGVTWHTLRHTFASRLVMLGVNLKTVQILMGHKTISMTARYAHLSMPHLKAAVELIVPSWWKKV